MTSFFFFSHYESTKFYRYLWSNAKSFIRNKKIRLCLAFDIIPMWIFSAAMLFNLRSSQLNLQEMELVACPSSFSYKLTMGRQVYGWRCEKWEKRYSSFFSCTEYVVGKECLVYGGTPYSMLISHYIMVFVQRVSTSNKFTETYLEMLREINYLNRLLYSLYIKESRFCFLTLILQYRCKLVLVIANSW